LPVIIECPGSDEIVIVGDALNELLASPDVNKKIGEAEAAVVIPRTWMR